MTASAVKSNQVTYASSIPVKLSSYKKMEGNLVHYSETIEAATTSIDEVGDIIHMLRIPSKCVPIRCIIKNDDLDSHSTPTLACDVGIYNAKTEAVKDADALASAITTLQAANTVGVDILHEAQDIANIGKTAWEIAGYTSDPGVDLLVSLTITTQAATAVTGTISLTLIAATE